MNDKILFVDDDPNILASYKRFHRKHFNIHTALGGEAGLESLEKFGPYAVIVSDLRMPHMNGIKFLAKAKRKSPDSVRILLTGQAELNDAITVINEGQIFRFLTKPCPPETFAQALRDGLQQYRLITSERELLNKTLKGSIKLLVDIISMIRPETIGRSIRIRSLANRVAERLRVKNMWQIDVAALLSQIGCVTTPQEILQKKSRGQALTQEENKTFLRHPEVGKALLRNIPRLEEVAEAIAYQEKYFNGQGVPNDEKSGKAIPLIARILKALLDYDELVTSGRAENEALIEMQQRTGRYDPDDLAALHAEILKAEKGYVVRELRAQEVTIGMILADDLRTKNNLLLLPKRYEISDTVLICIQNFAQNGNLAEPIKILKQADDER